MQQLPNGSMLAVSLPKEEILAFLGLGHADFLQRRGIGIVLEPLEAFLGYIFLGLFIAVISKRLKPT